MTERTPSPALRWQSLFFLFHYLFTVIVFSLPSSARGGDIQAALPDLHASFQNNHSQQISADEVAEDNPPLRDQMAQFWGSAQHGSAGDAARGMANSAVNNALTAEVERWLNLGEAKARVTLDAGLSGNHSRDVGLDYFWPLMEWEASTLFSQLSFHRWNGRNQFNVGLGVRHDLNERWLVGSNVFYDRDLSRRHSRLGVGAELWGAGLRTSANYYHPLSDWRLSQDDHFNDDPMRFNLYERPARGWDLAVEAALSQHIGVKGTFFQWYGDKVDVTGTRSQASRDPRGVTLGASWQPLPLVSLNAEHSTISGQNDDTRLGLNLNWQFGRTLDQMLDPGAATALSSLQDARHDFVSRNNNIVLTYQQREKGMNLYFNPTTWVAKAGSTYFTHEVNGGRGGFIVYHSSQPDVAQVVNEQAGSVAPLKRGEVTISAEEYQDASRRTLFSRAEYRLTILPGDFAPTAIDVLISGEATIGSILSGRYTFVGNEGADEGASLQRWYRADTPEETLSTNSQYQLTVADVGKTLVYEVTPVNTAGLRGMPASAQQAGPQLALNSLVISGISGAGEVLSDGRVKFKAGASGTLFFEATVQDKDGKPMPDQPVYWSHSNPALGVLEQNRQSTDSKGLSLVKFSDVKSDGEDVIVASLQPEVSARSFSVNDSDSRKSLPLAVIFSAAAEVKFIDPPTQVTVGTETAFVVQVTDEDDVAVQDTSLQITSEGKTTDIKTDKQGIARFSLTAPLSTEPAQWKVTAQLPANEVVGDETVLGLLADASSARVAALQADPVTAAAGKSVKLLATVQDKHGNPVRNDQARVSFLSSKTGDPLEEPVATNGEGVAIYPYVQLSSGTWYPAARVGGGVAQDTQVTFTAGQLSKLTLRPDFSGDQQADGRSELSWTVTAIDAHSNVIANAGLVWEAKDPAGNILPIKQKSEHTNEQGEGSVTVVLPKNHGELTISVSSNGQQDKVSLFLLPVLTLAALDVSSAMPVVGNDVTLTATVTDLAGTALENVVVDFTNDHHEVMTEQSDVKTDASGKAQAQLRIKPGKELGAPGRYAVTATLKVAPSETQTKQLDWQANASGAQVTALRANPTSAVVGDKVMLTATVKDQHGNPVPEVQVEFLNDAAASAPLITLLTDRQGEVSYPDYSQTTAANYYPAAGVVGGKAQDTTVTFTADHITTLQLTRDFTDSVLADGKTQKSWTVAAADRFGNRVADAALAWEVKGPTGPLTPVRQDNQTSTTGEGKVIVTMPETMGDLTVTVTSGQKQDNDSVVLQPVLTLVSLETSTATPVVGKEITLTAKVTDLAGTKLENVVVDFTNNRNELMSEQPNVKTNANGVAQAIVKIINGKEAGAPGLYEVTATLADQPDQQKSQRISWQAEASTARVTELNASPASAMAGASVTLSATVKDQYGNPVANKSVDFLSAAVGGTTLTSLSTNEQGIVSWNQYSQTTMGDYFPAAVIQGGTARETKVTFRADANSAHVTDLVSSPTTAQIKNNVSLQATVKDQYGNPVNSVGVKFLDKSGGSTLQKLPTNANGEVTWAGYTQTVANTYRPAARLGETAEVDTAVTFYGTPTINSVSVSPNGDVAPNQKLTATYAGFDAQGTGADRSTYQWYWRKVGDSNWAASQQGDAQQKTFTPGDNYDGYQVRVGVKPKGTTPPVEGTEVYSNPLTIRILPPSVTNVTISGDPTVTKTLTASYSYHANDGAAEGGTTFQWYLNDVVIQNATNRNYTVLRNNPGKVLTVKVTPKSQSGRQGNSVISTATAEVNPALLPAGYWFNASCTARDSQSGAIRWQMDNVDDSVSMVALIGGGKYTADAGAGGKSGLFVDLNFGSDYILWFEDAYGNKTAESRVKFNTTPSNPFTCQTNLSENGSFTHWPD